jgi:ribosomal protein L11 methyltransferase
VGKPSLLEVSLLVDGELAEAVSEVLARYIPSGIVIESTQISPDPDGEGHVIGPLRVYGYLPIDTEIEALRQKVEESLWYLSRIRPMPAPQFRTIEEMDWVETWKEHYHPIPIGKKLVILPAWSESQPGNRAAVRIEPGMAFGTGTHPTSQLCLELAEQHLKPGAPVIDIGCGSGILSIAALKLGASHALAVDVDPLAIKATLQNAALNQVEDQIEAGVGSLAEIRGGCFSIQQSPVVFANILAPVLESLLKEGLAELVAPGGIAILSGILAEQAEGVLAAAQGAGLGSCDRLQSGDWVAIGVAPA